jgi:hypothetical protein
VHADPVRADRPAATGQLIVASGALALIAAAAIAGPAALRVAPVAAAIGVFALGYRSLTRWPAILGGLLMIILFIPIRRYRVPFDLPFQLEPYRIYVIAIVAAWGVALLIDGRVRLRTSGLEGPILLLFASLIGSIAVNLGRISDQGLMNGITKQLTFLLSFVLVFYLIVSVVRTVGDAETPLAILVAGGAILGVLGVIEAKFGFNPFDHLDRVIPVLTPDDDLSDTVFRAGLTRAYGSAQHPIAFGAALVILLPPALYYAHVKRSKLAWAGALAILLGALTTVSRTTVVMLLAAGIVITVLRPAAVRKRLPLLLPALVVIQLALPGTLVTMKAMFLPEGGLIEEQSNASVGSGRVASLGPALEQVSHNPLLGIGYGSRIVSGPDKNSFILDDQWLGLLLETGALGVLAWVWLFWRFGRLAGGEARRDDSDRGWILVALTASIASFAAGMLFYDALSFIQVTILMFVLLGIGAALIKNGPEPVHGEDAAPARPRGARA